MPPGQNSVCNPLHAHTLGGNVDIFSTTSKCPLETLAALTLRPLKLKIPVKIDRATSKSCALQQRPCKLCEGSDVVPICKSPKTTSQVVWSRYYNAQEVSKRCRPQ
jgi:hypothetical protein